MTDEDILKMVRDARLEWFENPSGGFVTALNGLNLHLTHKFINISNGIEKITIYRPKRMLLNQPEEAEQLIDELRKRAGEQCLNRHSKEYQKNLRDKLIKKLMGLK